MYVNMYICMYICIYVYMYVYMYVNMYICPVITAATTIVALGGDLCADAHAADATLVIWGAAVAAPQYDVFLYCISLVFCILLVFY